MSSKPKITYSSPTGERNREFIIGEALRGKFDHNPLVSTLHKVTCCRCRNSCEIVYLDYIKKGLFKVGKTEAIEVPSQEGFFTTIEHEQNTPLIFEISCPYCTTMMEQSPFSVEYLLAITKSRSPSTMMYA